MIGTYENKYYARFVAGEDIDEGMVVALRGKRKGFGIAAKTKYSGQFFATSGSAFAMRNHPNNVCLGVASRAANRGEYVDVQIGGPVTLQILPE